MLNVHVAVKIVWKRGNYCPNCGADMREVIEDGNDCN